MVIGIRGVSLLMLCGAVSVSAASPTVAIILPSADGRAGCVVNVPNSADWRLSVDVREPSSPSADVLNELSPDARDFSSLPMAVRVENGGAGNTAPKLPDTIEAVVRHLEIEGVDTTPGFVRATFQRAFLTAGAAIVGERSRMASDGHRISTQTRCEIRAIDEARWR